MAICRQACPYNTLDGCKVKEYGGICQLTNTVQPITEYRMTNADRIRSMSDEELAEFIDDIAAYVATGKYCTGFLHVSGFPYTCFDTKKCCEKHVVEWLQQPAEVLEWTEVKNNGKVF